MSAPPVDPLVCGERTSCIPLKFLSFQRAEKSTDCLRHFFIIIRCSFRQERNEFYSLHLQRNSAVCSQSLKIESGLGIRRPRYDGVAVFQPNRHRIPNHLPDPARYFAHINTGAHLQKPNCQPSQFFEKSGMGGVLFSSTVKRFSKMMPDLWKMVWRTLKQNVLLRAGVM